MLFDFPCDDCGRYESCHCWDSPENETPIQCAVCSGRCEDGDIISRLVPGFELKMAHAFFSLRLMPSDAATAS